jgi:hypothetical protein
VEIWWEVVLLHHCQVVEEEVSLQLEEEWGWKVVEWNLSIA